ncbi:MAG: hypothetical protein HY714_05715 [Candidatus Omnitrophica bacterium]|nr:hypothetical protein [Candidatus Omnitrophota bacterium]
MRSLKACLVLLCLALSQPAALCADDSDLPYAARMPYRIIRGVTNIGLGWTEILLRPFGESKTESAGESMAMGAANTLIRVGVGIVDITTFWVPDMQVLDLYPDWQGWPYLFHWS